MPRGHRSQHILKLVHLSLKLCRSLLASYHPASSEVMAPSSSLPPSFPSSSESCFSRSALRDHFGFGPSFLLTAPLFFYQCSIFGLHGSYHPGGFDVSSSWFLRKQKWFRLHHFFVVSEFRFTHFHLNLTIWAKKHI